MLSEFMTSLSSKTSSDHITFDEFRDFLILLPRRASPSEIYRYFQVRKFMGVDGHGPARDSMEGLPILWYFPPRYLLKRHFSR